MNNCSHKDKTTGANLVVFDTGHWTGVYPKKIKGICVRCNKTFSLTEEEYSEFLKNGVINDD